MEIQKWSSPTRATFPTLNIAAHKHRQSITPTNSGSPNRPTTEPA
jgi:hypothetical protein